MDSALLKRLLSHDWVLDVRRPQCWFAENTQIVTNTPLTLKKHLGFDCSYKNYLILNGDEYYLNSDGDNYDHVFKSRLDKDSNFLKHFTQTIQNLANKADHYRQLIAGIDTQHWSNSRLAHEILRFQTHYTLSYVPAWSRPDGFLETLVKEGLERELKIPSQKVEEVFPKLASYPAKAALAYTDEPLKLLKIAREIQKGGHTLDKLPQAIEKKLLRHIQNYSWLKTMAQTEYTFFTREDYLSRLKVMLERNAAEEIRRVEQARLQSDLDYERMRKTYHFSLHLRELVATMREFIYLRTHTTEISDHLLITSRQTFLQEIANRVKLTNEQIVTLTAREINQLLEGNKIPNLNKLLTARQSAYAFILINRQLTTLIGKEAQEFYNRFTPAFGKRVAKAKTLTVTGSPASRGKVIGPAKILLTHKDVDKVKRGDILVAPVTTPDYIVAMEKAAAFVTDEGGITSHAAIVAREFGVPCVVDTQIATKVFHDNDTIEVDANKGTVKKIS